MDKNACKELVILLQQMINHKVQLIHGGQIFDWNDTKIPKILERAKVKAELEKKKSIFDASDN